MSYELFELSVTETYLTCFYLVGLLILRSEFNYSYFINYKNEKLLLKILHSWSGTMLSGEVGRLEVRTNSPCV